MQLGEFSSGKSHNSRNTSYRIKGAYTKEQSSILSQGHKKINSFNNLSERAYTQHDTKSSNRKSHKGSMKNSEQTNIILENLKLNRSKHSKASKGKRFNNRKGSDMILAFGNKLKLSKAVLGTCLLAYNLFGDIYGLSLTDF